MRREILLVALLSTLAATPSRADDIFQGLVAYWNFDGTLANTVGGPTYDGTGVNSPTFATNSRNNTQALSLDRSAQQYVVIPAPVETQGQSHSYSVWYKLGVSNIFAGERYFVLESTLGSSPSSDPAWTLSFELEDIQGDGEGDKLHVSTLSAGQQTTNFYYDIDTATEDQWHNMTVTANYSGSGYTHVFYLDGVQLAAKITNGQLMFTGGLVIGGHRAGTGRNWDGLIDEVAIWNRVLSPAEVASLQGTAPIVAPPLELVSEVYPWDSAEAVDGPLWIAQTFTSQRGGLLKGVDVLAIRLIDESPSDLSDLVLEVRATSGGVPVPPALASVSLPWSQIPATPSLLPPPDHLVSFDFEDQVLPIDAGVTYALVMHSSDSSPAPNDDYYWARSETNLLAGGGPYGSANFGSQWGSFGGGELGFRTYMTGCSGVDAPTATPVDQTVLGMGPNCEANVNPEDLLTGIVNPLNYHVITADPSSPYSVGTDSVLVTIDNGCGSNTYSAEVTVVDCTGQFMIGGLVVVADVVTDVMGSVFTLEDNIVIADPFDSSKPPLFLGTNSVCEVDTLLETISVVSYEFPSLENRFPIMPLQIGDLTIDPTPGQRSFTFEGELFFSDQFDGQGYVDVGILGTCTYNWDTNEMTIQSGEFVNMEGDFAFLGNSLLSVTGIINFDCDRAEFMVSASDAVDALMGSDIKLPITVAAPLTVGISLGQKAFDFLLPSSPIEVQGTNGLLAFGCATLSPACGGFYLRYDPTATHPIAQLRIVDGLEVALPTVGDLWSLGLEVVGQGFYYDNQSCSEVWKPSMGGTAFTITEDVTAAGKIDFNASLANLIDINLPTVDFTFSTVTDRLSLDVAGPITASVGPSGDPWYELGFETNGYMFLDYSSPVVVRGQGEIAALGIPELKLFSTYRLEFDLERGMFHSLAGSLAVNVPSTLSFLDNLVMADLAFEIDPDGIDLAAQLDTPVFDVDFTGILSKTKIAGSLTSSFGYKRFTIAAASGSLYLDSNRLSISAQARLGCIDIGTVTLDWKEGKSKPDFDYKSRFALCSPLDLHFYDGQGRHVGPNGSGQIDLEIPGAIYVEDGDHKYIELSSYDDVTDSSRVFLDGYAPGAYELIAHVPSGAPGSGTATFLSYQGTTTSAQTDLELPLGDDAQAAGFLLSVDDDGDGNFEGTQAPITMDVEDVDPSVPTLGNVVVVQALADGTAATVTWETSEPMTSQVAYGSDTSYGFLTPADPVETTQHTVTVMGLIPGATTHFSARSTNAVGQTVVSPDVSITTNRSDLDGDGFADNDDLCPTNFDPDQADTEGPGGFEGFESGDFAGWSFANSTSGLQSGTDDQGSWDTSLATNALDGAFSARMHAVSDSSIADWRVDAVMERQFPVASTFTIQLHFDDIQGGGGKGTSYFDVQFLNAYDPVQSYLYRFNTTGDLGGDQPIVVSPGDAVDLSVDVGADFLGKYGSAPTDVVVRLRANADYAEDGSGLRNTDVRVDRIEMTNVVYAEDWESGTTSDWSFQYSSYGAQSGSDNPGTWSTSVVSNALEGSYSVELRADATASLNPWQVNAAIDRVVPGGKRLLTSVSFDTIQDFSAAGHSFFAITARDAADRSRAYTWRFSEGTPLGGDEKITVTEGELRDLDLDLAGSLLGKYGIDPDSVVVQMRVSADKADTGNRSAHVRIDPILVTNGPRVPDGHGDACDNCALAWNPNQIDLDGNHHGDNCDPATAVSDDQIPTRYALHASFPNPFNGSTRIGYDVPTTGVPVRLRVYDVRGRLVRTLVDEPKGKAGRWFVTWDATDERRKRVASGVYLVRLEAGEFQRTRKIAYVK